MAKKVLIVDGVAGGASCAARLRRLDEEAEIILFEKGLYISFANCGLPYHIGGVIEDREELILQTPESFKDRFNVDVRINSEVTTVDRNAKTVVVENNGKIYVERYDYLVLSPGSSSIHPPIPGIDSDKIMHLWNLPDMDKVIRVLKEDHVRSAIVVGGGFVGLEMVENLKHAGLDVTLVEMMNQVMPTIDFDMAQILHKHLVVKGIKLVLGERVERFESSREGIKTITEKHSLEADMVILAIGVKPNSDIARKCGLALNHRGGIVVDQYLRTSDEYIYVRIP